MSGLITPSYNFTAQESLPNPELEFQITRRERCEAHMMMSDNIYIQTQQVIPGFDDVVGETLGGGYYYNTSASTDELVIAIRVANHPKLPEILKKSIDLEWPPEKVVEEIRKHQVLEAQRILDLGCGKLPGFALATFALGAEIHTADGGDLPEEVKKNFASHTSVDLNSENAPEVLKKAVGVGMDFVGENVIGHVPYDPPHLQEPAPGKVFEIAGAVLRPGGYVYGNTFHALDAAVFQKN